MSSFIERNQARLPDKVSRDANRQELAAVHFAQ